MTAYTGGSPTFATGEKTGVSAKLNQLRDLGRAFTDAWSPYTPTLTATTTNPTGWTQTGAWMQAGKLVVARFSLVAGGSMTAGNGNYEVALPVAPSSAHPSGFPIGQIFLYDASSGSMCTALAQLNASAAGRVRLNYGASAPVGVWTATHHSNPWAWATGDSITGQLIYEAA